MKKLIKRLEKAKKGSLVLDQFIWLGVYTNPTYKPTSHLILGYTTNINSALTLVPENWMISELCELENGYPWFALLHKRGVENTNDDVEAFSQTPALALCIAALKIRMK